MAIENTRDDILKHENKEYIESRPKWVTGRIPALADYRKLSVENFEEAFKLAKLGQQVTSAILPTFQGKPLLLTFTQALIVGAAILSREQAEKMGLDFEKYRSVLMVCPSRYGKSFLNAIVAIIKAGTEGKEVRIGGATTPKAGIIQEKVVTLLPSTIPAIQNGLVVTSEDGDVNKKVQRLATQASKEALQWQNGGSIKLFSTNEGKKNAEVGAAGAIGIGGDFVILDEIQLMTPVGFRTASRFMMENANTKRFCVGNPQINGHFKDLYDDPDTFVVHINDVTAIIEERMSRHGFELTGIPTYSEEYRAFIMCEFPDENSGTRFFPTLPTMFDEAKMPVPRSKQYFMGIDSAYKGGDSLLVTIGSLNNLSDGSRYFVVEEQIDLKEKYPEWTEDTTTNIALDILRLWQGKGVVAGAIDIGFGIHIYERIMQLDPDCNLEPVNFAQKPTEWRVESDYSAKMAANARAEMHLDLRDLCESGLVFINDGKAYDALLRQMREVGNKTDNLTAKIKIENKHDIKVRLGRSPDNLDSLCLTVRAMVLSGVLEGRGDDPEADDLIMEVL